MKIKICKTYNRKVSLKEITQRFDNIECGTSLIVETNGIETEEELNLAMKTLSKKVIKETERDMAEALSYIKEIVDDPTNSALVGEGKSITKKSTQSSKVENFDEFMEKYGFKEEVIIKE